MAWALKAVAVITERHFAAQVHTLLIQRNPVGTVAVLHPGLRVKLVAQHGAIQQKAGISSQVNNICLGRSHIKDALRVDLGLVERRRLELTLRANINRRAKLPRQIGIEHCQRSGSGLRTKQSQHSTHRPAQHLPPREAPASHFCRFSPAAGFHLILLRKQRLIWLLRCLNTHKLWTSTFWFKDSQETELEIEVKSLPGPGPHPSRAAEEAAHQRDQRVEYRKNGKERNGKLAICKGAAGVAVHIRDGRQAHQRQARNQHARNRRREIVEQLLQAQEVPGGLCRVRCQVRVSVIAQRRVDLQRQDGEDAGHKDRRHKLAHQEMRPHEDRVFELLLNARHRLLLHHSQRAIALMLNLLNWWLLDCCHFSNPPSETARHQGQRSYHLFSPVSGSAAAHRMPTPPDFLMIPAPAAASY